ncbi:aminotransferase class V-fold PLP-dependent enzyme [Paludisphaera rhizosphaerae]|uniref:aminotransferase class V-fold PLP-dependent enzyme n=1 Tax=Paludisphaera rhizosphaerae TaxID=2711216 RepID=UPI0013ED1952|nr:aminotransferase class V-fold PLP-dependent enzyme [Paludisphaera rhizosphaerae]
MIYLDNAATSFPKPEPVYQELDRFARTSLANPGRAGHRMAMAAEKTLDDVRHALNQFFRGESPDRWAFTLNCTDALNMAIKGVLRDGDHVVLTDLEHNSISRPIRALEKAGRITSTRVVSREGYVTAEDVAAAITPKTRLVAMTHASNVLGTVQPIEDVAKAVRAADALLLIDAAQSAGVVPIDLKETPIDLLALPGHKGLYGPTGTGTLYLGPRVDGRVNAWREGGTGGDSSSETQPDLRPYFYEAGSPNVLGVAGLGKGIAWVAERGVEALRKHEVELLQQVVDWAEHADGWRVAGLWDPERHAGALSLFTPEGISPQELAGILDVSFDIAVRPGLHCAPYIHRNLGSFPDGLLRLSPSPFTSHDDIRQFLDALSEITAGVV